MNEKDNRVLIIVPAYNEAGRLPQKVFLNELPQNVDVLFANDGSTDKTRELLEQICDSKKLMAFHAEKNKGKANVIHDAFVYAKANELLKPYDWIGFWDADLATPLPEIQNYLNYQKSFSPNSKALFGCRLDRYGASITRSKLRHYLSRVFVTFTDFLLGVRAYDSQCGAKLFHKSVVDRALGKPFISKWIFDIEFILRLSPSEILEIPVFNWRDVPGSKVKIGRESFRVLSDLFKIRSQYKEQIQIFRSHKK